MNLIEKLGLEKCKQIVDGAPEGSEMWRDMDSVCSPGEVLYYRWFGGALIVNDAEKGWIKSIYHDGNEYILDQLEGLSDLRAALADHNSKPCQHGYDIACLICGFGTENGVRVWRKQIETDNVTDIRNHISPNTKVIER